MSPADSKSPKILRKFFRKPTDALGREIYSIVNKVRDFPFNKSPGVELKRKSRVAAKALAKASVQERRILADTKLKIPNGL